jgi:dephospho-CoA kinase
MLVVGITGTIGAGKGTIVEYLVKKGFTHYSVREFLLQEIKKRNLPANRDSMVLVANDLRKNNVPSYIVDCLFEQAARCGKNAVIESIRSIGEVDSLRKKDNFVLLAVDALPQLRYKRIVERNSETDHVSFEQFLAAEAVEFSSQDPTKQNLSQCISMADFVITNNDTKEDLYHKIETVIIPKLKEIN